ncbi:MAG: transporter substrate-binding domain-containing protein [Rhodoferax sp.]|nr:transporter substrate-binding domain-containing protein [Rhodoferax sp.]MDP3652279.1 transporter substrate-binding domain-containing protein [Rhodoferax sp.]
MKHLLAPFLLTVGCLAGGSAIAQQPLKIGSFPIPLMVESADKGVFIELTKEVAKRAGLPIEIEVVPTKRTIDNFAQNAIAGYFPALDVVNPGPVSKSIRIYVKNDYAFTKEGANLKTIKDLEGQSVGITLGYPYASELTGNKKINFQVAKDDTTNMKKLAAGRIAAFVVEERSGLKALEQSGEKGISYDPKVKLSEQNVYYAFQPTPEGKIYADKFSKALTNMENDGTLAAIMGKAK